MAYLIFTIHGDEYDRRELRDGQALTIGRAPDCDVSIHDIILSRHHCRVEQDADGKWVLVDLDSKNGTQYLGHNIERHVLRDKDELRIGRTRLTFLAGAFVRAKNPRNKPAVARPADPKEALSGTVTGMVLCEPGETERYEHMPFPQPRPSEPKSYSGEGVDKMINEIISSSWDSIQAQASEPTRMQRAMPVPAVTKAHRGVVRPTPRVSFALQAERDADPAKSSSSSSSSRGRTNGQKHKLAPEEQPPPAPAITLAPPEYAPRAHRRRRRWAVAVSTLVATVLYVVVWVTLILQASPRPALNDAPAPAGPDIRQTRSGVDPEAAVPASATAGPRDAVADLDLLLSQLADH